MQTFDPINPNDTKVEQSFFPLSLKPSSPTTFPLAYSDNIWDMVRQNTALFTISGQIGQYTQHDINEMIGQYVVQIVENLGLGCLYLGVASLSLEPDTRVKGFYLAVTAGTYQNFLYSGGTAITVDQGEIAALVRSGNAWTKQHIMIRPYIDPVSKHWIIDGQDSGIVAEGVDGKSAYEVWLDAGNQGTEQNFLNSLKATVGAFMLVDYDGNAPSIVGGTATAVGGVTASASTKDVIVLMPNAASDPTATRMYVTNEVSASSASDAPDPTVSYQFVYIGDLSVDLRFGSGQSLNDVDIVNDLTTGGVNDVLSAEQGKVLGLHTLGGRAYNNYVALDLYALDVVSIKFSTAAITEGRSYEIDVSSYRGKNVLLRTNPNSTTPTSLYYIGFSVNQITINSVISDFINTPVKFYDNDTFVIPDTANYMYVVRNRYDVSGSTVENGSVSTIAVLDSYFIYGGVNSVNLSKDGKVYASKLEARSFVPADMQFKGVELQYLTSDGWVLERYIGNTWGDENSWDDLFPDVQFETGEKVKDVGIDDEPTSGSDNLVKSGGIKAAIPEIANNLNGGTTKALSAEQGKVVNNKILHNNYEYKAVVTGTNVDVAEFQNVVFAAGTTFFVYPDTERNIRFYSGSSYTDVSPGEVFVAQTDIDRINKRLGNGLVHILINQTTANFNENSLLYDKISIKNLIEENVVVNVVNFEITSTTTTTNIFSHNVPKIPAGSMVHIETSDFSSFATRIRYFFNGSSAATYLKDVNITFEATSDITAVRFATANGDFIEGATGGTISIKLWWEDVKYQIDEIKNEISVLESKINDSITNLTKEGLIEAAGNLYDSANDKFLSGTISFIIGTDLTHDLICNYVAKYTSTNNSYPYIQVYYLAPPFNNVPSRFRYEIGANGYYKYGECRCICPINPPLTQPVFRDYYVARIVIPEGCELFIQSISSDIINRSTNTNAFRIFNHGSVWGTGFNCKDNWDGWSHIGNYGAVVVPKRTTDGRWVCYHDDSFGSDPDVQVIGDPTAALPAASMQACTFAETQTLEYKAANYFGDHPTIPTLDEFFAKCSQMGVHPMLSIHPGWNESQWQEIKEIAIRYKVLDKLNIKGSFSATVATTIYNVFGNDIESYIPDHTGATVSDVESLAAIGWDRIKVKVGFEYMATSENQFFSDEVISALRQNNMVTGFFIVGASDGHFIKDLIDNKLLWEYTSNFFYSNGLNWS